MIRTLRYLLNHPLNAADRRRALGRFVRWQLAARLMPYPCVVPFVDDTVLVLEKGMTGATGNWYAGLHEPADMGFMLHVLREEDLFLDVGANVGSYTVLAAGAVGARTICIEPVPSTFTRLIRNVTVNGLSNRVQCHNVGAGAQDGVLRFTTERDTVNQVVTEDMGENVGPVAELQVRQLDTLLDGSCPTMIKIDVEGWEAEVLRGLTATVSDQRLAAIIMETNASGERYSSGQDRDVTMVLQDHGFSLHSYDPITRRLLSGGTSHNTIFIRDVDLVTERIASARRFRLVTGDI